MFLFSSLSAAFAIPLNETTMPIVFQESSGPIFVEVWDPWCAHCKHFRPEWERIIQLDKYKGRVTFATVNCGMKGKICSKFPGNETPRFFWFDNSTAESRRFPGSPTGKTIEEFIDTQLGEALTEVDASETNEALQQRCKKGRGRQCFLFALPKGDSKTLSVIQRAATSVKHLPISMYFMRSSTISKPKLSVIGPIDDVFTEQFTEENVKHYLKLKSLPFLSIFTDMTMFYSEMQEIPVCAFVHPDNGKYLDLHKYAPLTNKYFSTLQTSCRVAHGMCNYVWESAGDEGFIVVVNRSQKNFWIKRGPFTEEGVSKWAKSIHDHTLKPYGPGTSAIGRFVNVYYMFREIGGMRFYIIHIPLIISAFMIFFILYALIDAIIYKIRVYRHRKRMEKRLKD